MKNSFLLLLLPILLSCGEAKQPAIATLAAPTDVSAQALSATEALLSWTDQASDESGYYVFGQEAQPQATLPANSTSFTFKDLTPEKTYHFAVQAYEKNGILSLKVTAPPLTLPAVEPEPAPEPEPDPSTVICFNWTQVSAPELPAAIKLYRTEDPLEGKPFHAWYAEADCSADVEFKVLFPGDQQTKTIDDQAAANEKCLVLINGGIFSAKFLRPIGFAIADGQQTPWRVSEDEDKLRLDREYWSADGKLHPVSRGLFGVDQAGHPAVYWSFTPEYGKVWVYDQPIPSTAGETPCPSGSETYPCPPADWTPYNAVTCGPVLLKDGESPISAEKTAKGYWKTNYELWADDIFGVTQHPDRTAVGYKEDGTVVLLICDGRISASDGATTLQMAKIMRGLGCVGALNLDGGGSTGMWVKGKGHLNDLSGGNRPVITTLGFFAR